MGDHESWAQPNGLLPNGLLPNEAAGVTRVLDVERWSKAEERTAELIAFIQPNPPSEERRNAVAEYVQRLIMRCFSCQVFTFGSVPLKTYLPDGDIDLTAFSKNQNLKDTWANEVRDVLENEEKSANAEFRVKEVQYIQAEVKIIKCLVENIVVDISFNQIGGLCTLCFLEQVDHLINQNHLFKRSIILIKAWCYYESRILGAHHGLISTYALETLVLYIFHVFNNSFAGPLEVLYRFLEFFSNFDWSNFCVSLWGPVPINSLPDMTAEPPRRDSGELFLSKLLDDCSSMYAVFPSGHDSQGQPFASKHFNVIDPLRTNNNLGRSVSKGNFYRIRSAFAFGAKRLARLLECPKENLIAEVNQFFMNTWERHGSGHRPDAPPDRWYLCPSNPDSVDGSENPRNHKNSKKKGGNVELPAGHESRAEGPLSFHAFSSRQVNPISHPSETVTNTSNASAVSRTQSQKIYGNQISSRISDQVFRNSNLTETAHPDKSCKSSKPDYSVNEREGHGRFYFARTRSSPELTDTSGVVMSRGRRNNRVPETGKNQFTSTRLDHGSRRKNFGSEVSGCPSARSSNEDPSSFRDSSSHQSFDAAADSNSVLNSYHDDAGLGATGEEFGSATETIEMNQEEQDLVNMMSSSRVHSFNGQVHIPMDYTSAHLPPPISPTVLASMGYTSRNMAGVVPTNIPLIEPSWGSNMQFPQGVVSSPLPHYFPSVGLASNPNEIVESANDNSGLTEMNQENGDPGFWHEPDSISTGGFEPDIGGFHMLQLDEKQQSTSGGYHFLPPSRVGSPGGSFAKGQNKFVKENRGILREDQGDTFLYQNNRGNDVHSMDHSPNLRFVPVGQASSSRSKPTSSESSWDGSSARVSKSIRDKRGRKTTTSAVSSVYGKDKSGWGSSSDHVSSQTDDDSRDWFPLSPMGIEMAERSTGSGPAASAHLCNDEFPGYETAQINGSDSVIPISPVLIGSGSRRGMDNAGVGPPLTFYATGPPVPFFTIPVYNIQTEAGNSNGPTGHFGRDDGTDNSRINQTDQSFDIANSHDQPEIFASSTSINSMEPSEEQKSDILNSDFASHLQNLQYGRLCQNTRYHGPLIYSSPVVVPPMYFQGHFPWDGPGRPLSANMNLITQLMSYGPRFVPVAPLHPGSNRPSGAYQRYGDDIPRYRGGTGTYLPNPAAFRDRQSSNTRNHRGNYNHTRNDHNDREGTWNSSSRSRNTGRNHGRSQTEKPTRSDRSWDSYRHEPLASYQAQNGPFASVNSVPGSPNMAYSMYPLPTVNSNGVTQTGHDVPSVVMLYSYDHNAGYNAPTEQLEFGSLGPVHFSGMNDLSQQRHGTYQGGSPVRSSPDQPSSPQVQRAV